jgi:hypothetical protein
LAGSAKTIVEKWPGSCKGKTMSGKTLTWGDAETIRRAYNCSDHVSNAKFVILLQVNTTICLRKYEKLSKLNACYGKVLKKATHFFGMGWF